MDSLLYPGLSKSEIVLLHLSKMGKSDLCVKFNGATSRIRPNLKIRLAHGWYMSYPDA